MVNNLKSLSNPQGYINNILKNNPQVSQLLNQYGSPKQAFMNVAKQKGVDPSTIINLFR